MTIRLRKLAVLTLLPLMLAACQSHGDTDDESAFNMIKESPTLRKEVIEDCNRHWQKYRHNLSDEYVSWIGVPRDKTVETFCSRLYNGIASGRITLADWKRWDGDYMPPAMAAVIRGR